MMNSTGCLSTPKPSTWTREWTERESGKVLVMRDVTETPKERELIAEESDLKPNHVVKSDNIWHRRPHGFDGLLQEPWPVWCATPIQESEASTGVRVFVIIRRDDVLLIVIRTTQHGVKNKKTRRSSTQLRSQLPTTPPRPNCMLDWSNETGGKKRQSAPPARIRPLEKVILWGSQKFPLTTKVGETISTRRNTEFPTLLGGAQAAQIVK